MIFFFLDILIYNLTSFSTYLILLNLNKKDNYYKIILISFILDFIILNTYYKNILVFILLIFINNYILNYKLTNLVNYLSINILNYSLFIVLSNIINMNMSFTNISLIILNNFIIYILISLVYYYKFINKT